MLDNIKKWVKSWFLPKDPSFKQRVVAQQKFGSLILVELGASDYVIIHDMLAKIQLEDKDDATKSREMIGLRYMALAMSLRTRAGRIPLDWQDQNDLLYLATLPYSQVIPALDAIALLSGIDWITPNFKPPETESAAVEVEPPSQEELDKNPS